MPRGQDYDPFSSVNSTGYVWGDQNGVFGRFAATTFQGPQGIAGADGAAGYTVIDNNGASSDLSLNVGDLAYRDFVVGDGTSIPLNIATVEGIYEMKIIGYTTVSGASGSTFLNPNNTTYAAAVKRQSFAFNSATAGGSYTTQANLSLYDGRAVSVTAYISTFTNSKTVHTHVITENATTMFLYNMCNIWTDTNAWTSLGTLSLGFVQAGKVYVRRLL